MNSINEQNMDEKFDAKRTELLRLLNKSEEIVDRLNQSGYFPSDTKDLRKQISETRQLCHEGLFSIALIAAFQSGKSTTLNAFADGREVAPRGGGIKTSACLVKVRNPNQGEKETAKITWRTHKDLLLRLDEILGTTACQIPDSEMSKKLKLIYQNKAHSQTDKEREEYNQEYLSTIDFRTSKGKILLEQALREDLKNCAEIKKKKQGSENIDNQLDLLRFAMIILAYYDDPVLQNLQKQTDFQPEEIQDYLKFPKEFGPRWNKCFDNFQENLVGKEFRLSEVMYAFIEEVTYIVNSENLRKSGAQIVDCPGLFVSNYDTSVAIQAMHKSSAIWYLITGDKELQKSEKDTLRIIIQDPNLASKVFFGVNYQDNPNTKKDVTSTNLDTLRELGFTASYQQQFLYFNAFLALRGMQGEKLLSNNLDSYSQEQIKRESMKMLDEDVEFDSVEQAWLESVESSLGKVVTKSRRQEILSSGFAQRTVELVKFESKWDLVTDKIEQYVFETKAWSVLVDNGCEPVINTLEKTEASLKLAEENVYKSLEKAQEEWRNAREKLAEFQEESQPIITDYIDDSWELILAKSFWKEVFIPSIKATGESAASKIASEATILNALGDPFTQAGNKIAEGMNWLIEQTNSFKDNLLDKAKNYVKKDPSLNLVIDSSIGRYVDIDNIKIDDIDKIRKAETLKERCGKIISAEFENNVSIKSQGWFNSLKKGGNQDYETKILQRVLKACERLVKEWKSLDLNHNSYLQGLDVNIPKLSGDIRRDMEKYNQVGLDEAADKSIEKPFQDIGIVFGSFYFLFLFDLIIPGVGVVLFSLAILAVVIASRFKPEDEYKRDIANKIIEELDKGVKKEQDNITEKLQDKLKVVRNFYLQSITNSFNKMNEQLEQRIKEANAIFREGQAKRDEIGKIAEGFRKRDIEPLRQELQRFQFSVEEIWKKPS